MRILIAIPVYNERRYVSSVLAQVRRFSDQILVVDDASTDGTTELLAEMARRGEVRLLRHLTNRGYGQSLIDAFKYADEHGYDWVLTMDGDEQHSPEQIPEFVRAMEEDDSDIISGSRYLRPRSDDDLPPTDRQSINMTLTTILNDLFHYGLTDAFCGFKAHRVSALRRLRLDVAGYAFPMQFWPQVAAAELRVREIPVRLIYNDPNRHFGGELDDPGNRLNHYLEVLRREMDRIAEETHVGNCCC
ncbi:MAG TPA: glycosyltransferase family 2 protein [Tepidisphaeraceae bacterium]|nr:glycosyltransferase family 2 protein [Tepidisphaeraceae bacterium]